jgi:uncharacterized protein (TIGR02611 family)
MTGKPNPISTTARKVGVGAAGMTTVAVGLVLIPLPGPGTLIVLGGLGILGSEFPAARRLSDRIKSAARGAVDRALHRTDDDHDDVGATRSSR